MFGRTNIRPVKNGLYAFTARQDRLTRVWNADPRPFWCDEVTSQVLSTSLLAVYTQPLGHCRVNQTIATSRLTVASKWECWEHRSITFPFRVLSNCLRILRPVWTDRLTWECAGQQLTRVFPFGTARAAFPPPFPSAGHGSWYTSPLYHFYLSPNSHRLLLRAGTSVNNSG